jgi:hypothetical protein
MSKCIVYQGEDGLAVVLMPSPDCGLTVEQIAFKDVPFGKMFKIMNLSEIPEDIFSWIIDSADLTDGVGTKV